MGLHYTHCTICSSLCGLAVHTTDGRITKILPDKQNRYSWRDFCVKGAKTHENIYHPDRITAPMKRVGNKYVTTTYKQAVEEIAAKLNVIVKESGVDAVGSYAGNPNGYNFGSGAFHALFTAALGSKNKYSVSSIDQNAAHVVSRKMFNTSWGFFNVDIDHCNCFFLLGTNPAVTTMGWLAHTPNGWKRLLARQKQGAKLIVADPRYTETAQHADLHLPALPNTDWALLLCMLHIISSKDLFHRDAFDKSDGFDELRRLVDMQNPTRLAKHCDVPLEKIVQAVEYFVAAEGAAAVAHTGASQTFNGCITLWLTNVLNIATGKIGCRGGLYYNLGLLDVLTEGDNLFPDFSEPSRVRGIPSVLGYRSLAELPDEINTPGKGQVRALILNGGNPVITGPDGAALDKALKTLELLVCVDFFKRDSHRHADWIIPAVHFLERGELHVLAHSLNDIPFAQVQRKAVDPPTGVEPEWRFLYRPDDSNESSGTREVNRAEPAYQVVEPFIQAVQQRQTHNVTLLDGEIFVKKRGGGQVVRAGEGAAWLVHGGEDIALFL